MLKLSMVGLAMITTPINPKIIVTHHSNDLNIDHKIIHQAVFTACSPKVGSQIKRILSFEVPSATEWASPSQATAFTPNYFEDITNSINLKLKTLKVYNIPEL